MASPGASSSVGIFWGDEALSNSRSIVAPPVLLPGVQTASTRVLLPIKKTRSAVIGNAVSLPDLRVRQLVIEREDAASHASSMSLLVVLQTLWQSIAHDTNAFAQQICQAQVAYPTLLRQRYYNNSVFQEDRSYFLQEREAAIHEEAIRRKSKPSSVTEDKQQYPFDRRRLEVAVPTKSSCLDEKKLAEDRLMDRHDHKIQHLLHVLQSEITNETQREICGLHFWSPTKKLSRQSKRQLSNIVKERYEAADRIMRILEEYRIVVGVDAARYLQQTIEEGNRIVGKT